MVRGFGGRLSRIVRWRRVVRGLSLSDSSYSLTRRSARHSQNPYEITFYKRKDKDKDKDKESGEGAKHETCFIWGYPFFDFFYYNERF